MNLSQHSSATKVRVSRGGRCPSLSREREMRSHGAPMPCCAAARCLLCGAGPPDMRGTVWLGCDHARPISVRCRRPGGTRRVRHPTLLVFRGLNASRRNYPRRPPPVLPLPLPLPMRSPQRHKMGGPASPSEPLTPQPLRTYLLRRCTPPHLSPSAFLWHSRLPPAQPRCPPPSPLGCPPPWTTHSSRLRRSCAITRPRTPERPGPP